MSIGPNRWQRVRWTAKAHRPRPVIRSCEIRPRWGAGYEVTIEGLNLTVPGILSEVHVGDQLVSGVRVSPAGKITGMLARRPSSRELVVVVGSSEVRAQAKVRSRPAPPDLDDLARLLSTWRYRVLGRLPRR